MNTQIPNQLSILSRLCHQQDIQGVWSILKEIQELLLVCNHQLNPEVYLYNAKNVILYGAGNYARTVLKRWESSGLSVNAIIDSNPLKWGSTINGINVYGVDYLNGFGPDSVIVITAMNTHGISDRISKYGIPFLYAEKTGEVGFHPGVNLLSRETELNNLYELLSDSKSKEVLLSVLLARMFQDFKFPSVGNIFTHRCSTFPQYFPSDIIRLTDKECFVDCGVFDGDTLFMFADQAYKQKCFNWRAIGFEADLTNIDLAKRLVANFPEWKVSIHQQILGSGAEQIDSLSLHNCNGVDITGSSDTETIDNLLRHDEPTYIKMDIEGAELPTLIGSSNTIQRCRPKLAICTYHSTDELVNIPLYISKSWSFYDLFLRHHGSGTLWETVCYAIPKNN